MKFHKVSLLVLITCSISVLVACAVFMLGQPQNSLSRQNDAFFYAAEARAQATGIPIATPIFSTLTSSPSNLYFLYTKIQGLFVPESSDWKVLLERLRLFQVVMAGLLAAIIFVCAYDLSRKPLVALVGSLAAITTSLLFRITPDRPEAVTAILFLLFSWGLIRRNYYLVALTAFCFPLMYSVSFVLLVPAAIYALAAAVKGGVKGLRHEFCICLTAVVATIAGIAVHPQALNYLFNGSWLNLYVLSHAGKIPEASELLPVILTVYEWAWIGIFALTIALLVYYVYKNRSIALLQTRTIFLTLLVFFLAALYLYSMRFANFFFPIFGVWIAHTAVSTVVTSRRILFSYLVLVFGISLTALYFGMSLNYKEFNNYLPLDLYQNTAIHLSLHPGLVVNRFDTYAPLIFFHPQAQLTSGRANVFMHAYSADVYSLYFGLGKYPAEVIMKVLGARYFLDDGRNKQLSKYLATNKCLFVSYEDPAHPQMKLFEILPACKEVLPNNKDQ